MQGSGYGDEYARIEVAYLSQANDQIQVRYDDGFDELDEIWIPLEYVANPDDIDLFAEVFELYVLKHFLDRHAIPYD